MGKISTAKGPIGIMLEEATAIIVLAKEDIETYLADDPHDIKECGAMGIPCSTHEVLNRIEEYLGRSSSSRIREVEDKLAAMYRRQIDEAIDGVSPRLQKKRNLANAS